MIFALIIFFLVTPCPAWSAEPCSWPEGTQRSLSADGAWTEISLTATDFKAQLVESKELPAAFLNSTYRQYVSSRTDTDPFYLLRKQRKLYETHYPEFVRGFDRVIHGEFGASVLQSGTSIRILFRSSEFASIPRNESEENRLRSLLSQGFRYRYHIHNHPFLLDNRVGDIGGTPFPSGSSKAGGDVHTLLKWSRDFHLEGFRITNGFSTLTASKQKDFPLLENWP